MELSIWRFLFAVLFIYHLSGRSIFCEIASIASIREKHNVLEKI